LLGFEGWCGAVVAIAAAVHGKGFIAARPGKMEGAEQHQELSLIPEEEEEEEKNESEVHRDPIQELEDLARGDAAKAAAAEGQVSTSEEAAAEGSRPLVRRCRKLLYRSMKVGVEDGRVFIGIFHCLDKQGNIILHSTVEYRDVSSKNGEGSGSSNGPPVMEERPLGLVLIPARCRTSCYVECSLDESMDLLSLES